MRSSVALPSPRFVAVLLSMLLAATMIPIAAYAAPREANGDIAGDVDGVPDAAESDLSSSSSTGTDPDEAGADPSPAMSIIDQEMSLEAMVAQAESTRSYLLARTLESTRTVPVVSAKLPVADDAPGEVVGSFTYRGVTYAVEPGGESVAVVAVDYAKLPADFLEARTIVLPSVVSPNGVDSYSVSRISDGAFSGLTVAAAIKGSKGDDALSSSQMHVEASDDGEERGSNAGEGNMGVASSNTSSVVGASPNASADPNARTVDSEGPTTESSDEVSVDGGSSDGVDPGANAVDAADAFVDESVIHDAADTAEDDDVSSEEGASTGITAVTIPSSVMTIESDAFRGFETLQYVVVSADNPNYSMYDGCLYDKSLQSLLLIPEGRLGAVRILSSVTAEGFDPEAFSHCASVDTLVAEADSAAYQLLTGDDGSYSFNGKKVVTESVYSEDTTVTLQYAKKRTVIVGEIVDIAAALTRTDSMDGHVHLAVSSEGCMLDETYMTIPSPGSVEAILATESATAPRSLKAISLNAIDPYAAAVQEPASTADSDASETSLQEPIGSESRIASAAEMLPNQLQFTNSLLRLGLSSFSRWVISSDSGFDGTVSWTGGTSAAPTVGSIVNVYVTRLVQDGNESTPDLIRESSVVSWGATDKKEFIGFRNRDTGSFVSIDNLFSGEPFSFSFVMPASGCSVVSYGLSWTTNTSFEPVFQDRSNTILTYFELNASDAKWQNVQSGHLSGSAFRSATYSTIGEALMTPTRSLPVRSGYIFLGWYEDVAGTSVIPAVAAEDMGDKTFYAKWGVAGGPALSVQNGMLWLALESSMRWVISSTDGFDGSISWTGGTAASPSAGSIVNVNVTRLHQDGGEATPGLLRNASIRSWGASESREFIGFRNKDTGSFVSIDNLFSGESFSFSFVMPVNGCDISSSAMKWTSNTTFEPVFALRSSSVCIDFTLNASDAKWRNSVTGVLCNGFYNVTTYSRIGDLVVAPTQSIPVRDGYTFLGWYENADGTGETPGIAEGDMNRKVYYAKWGIVTGSFADIKNGSLQLGLGSFTRWVISAGGGFDGSISWVGGTSSAPTSGSIVNVTVTRLVQNGGESTLDLLRHASIESWGASENEEFVGFRNRDTGSFVSVENLFSGESFSFAFVKPEENCSISSTGMTWTVNTTFEPVFAVRESSVYAHFDLNAGDARWRNPVTGVLCEGAYTAATYSVVGQAITAPTQSIPVRTGYTFMGWYTAPSGGHVMFGNASESDNGRRFYARWSRVDSQYYFLTLSGNDDASSGSVRWTNEVGNGFTLPEDVFDRVGHTCTSWNTQANGTGTRYDVDEDYAGLAASSTLVLYAQWTPDIYEISYDLAGGSKSEEGVYPESYSHEEGALSVSDPMRIGYDFAGWLGTGLTEPTVGLVLDKNANDKLGAHQVGTALYARSYTATWTPRTYKMSFDLAFDDGSASWKDGEAPAEGSYDAIVYDTAVTFPKAPVRPGWMFDSWVRTDEPAGGSYAAEETIDPANFESEQDAIASFEAHWVKNLKVTVPLGSKDVDMAVSADLVDGTEFDIDKGVAEIVNLSDGELKVVSVREDTSDADALATRRANALEAFGGTTSDASKLDAVSFVLRPTADGTTADSSKEEARFVLFGSHTFQTDSWRIPASTDPINGTTSSTLRILYDMAFDYSKIALTDLKLNLEAKPISSLIYTVELVDQTEPEYSVSV